MNNKIFNLIDSERYVNKKRQIQSNFHINQANDHVNLIYDIDKMRKTIAKPKQILAENFTKAEQIAIMKELDYFIKDETFKKLLPGSNEFKLIDALENEEKVETDKKKRILVRTKKLDFRDSTQRQSLFKFFGKLSVLQNEEKELFTDGSEESDVSYKKNNVASKDLKVKFKNMERLIDLKIQGDLLDKRLKRRDKKVWESTKVHKEIRKLLEAKKVVKQSEVLNEGNLEKIIKSDKVFSNLKANAVFRTKEYFKERLNRIKEKKEAM